MVICKAALNDIDTILDLLSQVLEIHAAIRPDIFNQGVTKYRREELEEMVFDENNPIYVTKVNDEAVAYAFCQIRLTKFPHLMKPQKTLYIDDFCVDEKYRKQGIGKALFEFLVYEAERLGCDDITLNSWAGNIAANDFYAKMGMKPRSSILEYKIK